jgi:hypothetical protein
MAMAWHMDEKKKFFFFLNIENIFSAKSLKKKKKTFQKFKIAKIFFVKSKHRWIVE